MPLGQVVRIRDEAMVGAMGVPWKDRQEGLHMCYHYDRIYNGRDGD
jgi:hypothetical protein